MRAMWMVVRHGSLRKAISQNTRPCTPTRRSTGVLGRTVGFGAIGRVLFKHTSSRTRERDPMNVLSVTMRRERKAISTPTSRESTPIKLQSKTQVLRSDALKCYYFRPQTPRCRTIVALLGLHGIAPPLDHPLLISPLMDAME